jgi:hypothetical protein
MVGTSPYDRHGRVLTAVDALGNTTTTIDPAFGLPTKIEDPNKRYIEISYDALPFNPVPRRHPGGPGSSAQRQIAPRTYLAGRGRLFFHRGAWKRFQDREHGSNRGAIMSSPVKRAASDDLRSTTKRFKADDSPLHVDESFSDGEIELSEDENLLPADEDLENDDTLLPDSEFVDAFEFQFEHEDVDLAPLDLARLERSLDQQVEFEDGDDDELDVADTERVAKAERVQAPAKEDLDELPALALADPPVKEFVEKRARRILHLLKHGKDSDGPAVSRLLDHYRKARATTLAPPFVGPAERTTGTGAMTGKPTVSLSKAFVVRATKSPTKGLCKTRVEQGGAWAPTGLASGPGVKNTVRDLQLANHLSAALVAITGATEVEAMIVNNRILVSANKTTEVAELRGLTLTGVLKAAAANRALPRWTRSKIHKLVGLRAALLGGADPDDVGKNRLARLLVDSHEWPEQSAAVYGALLTLKAADTFVDGGSERNAARMITDPVYEGQIIVVDTRQGNRSIPCSHAEQNLVLALLHTGLRGLDASIAGAKRPCTICFLSMALVQRYRYGTLRFNHHPGGYWKGTTAEGLQHIVALLGFTQREFTHQMDNVAQDGITHYVTDTRPNAARTAPVDDLPGEIGGSYYQTNTNTQSQSQDEESYSLPSSPEATIVATSDDE